MTEFDSKFDKSSLISRIFPNTYQKLNASSIVSGCVQGR